MILADEKCSIRLFATACVGCLNRMLRERADCRVRPATVLAVVGEKADEWIEMSRRMGPMRDDVIKSLRQQRL